MILYVVIATEECCMCVCVCVAAHEQTHAYKHAYVCWTLEAAGLWMSLPGDPEDCSKCVSVSLINFNTGAFGTCGQVNETQWEGTFPGSHPAKKLRVMGWGSATRSLSPSAAPSLPTGQFDSLFGLQGRVTLLPPHPSYGIYTLSIHILLMR